MDVKQESKQLWINFTIKDSLAAKRTKTAHKNGSTIMFSSICIEEVNSLFFKFILLVERQTLPQNKNII